MAYTALYREFRPKKFEEVIGQEHITDTLRRQVKNNRVAHAYLFSGGRGSGKTSTAKILSRAINCLNTIDGEPCNECEICKLALEGSLTDITEIDAASNNGVDNIRDIREEVEFLPTNAKHRVYIIDEVHMLSTGAFNALLKTLEEPPSHVVFILATTEPQKLPVTILSRCQRFEFKKISIDNISKALKKCTEIMHIEVEENAISLIARMADGAMRDAYSILDRCIADGESKITEQKVRELVGIPSFDSLSKFISLILNYNSKELIDFMEQIIREGKNVEVFLNESIKLLRDILILKTSNSIEGFSESEKNNMERIASSNDTNQLIQVITCLAGVQGNIKWSSDTEVAFETGVLKAVFEINNEEGKIYKNENDCTREKLKSKVLTKLKENSKIRVCAVLQNSQIIKAEEGLIHIIFENAIDEPTKKYLQNDETKMAIKQAIVEIMNQDYKVKYVFK